MSQRACGELKFVFLKPTGVYNSGIDYCDTVSTYDEYKGEIHWPVTGAGSRRLVRCPYSYDDPSYASYDCLLSDDNHMAEWMNLNIDTCPDPPFTRAVDLLNNAVVSIERSLFHNLCIFSARRNAVKAHCC